MKIFLVTGEHPTVPGLRLSAHFTHESALGEAVSLVQIIRNDWPKGAMPRKITPKNWEKVLVRLQDLHGAQYCDVTIAEFEVKGVPSAALPLALGALTKAAHFIEDVGDDAPNRTDLFFEAREAWREAFAAAGADPVRAAAKSMLDAFGGDVPDWLRPQADALAVALNGSA